MFSLVWFVVVFVAIREAVEAELERLQWNGLLSFRPTITTDSGANIAKAFDRGVCVCVC